MKTEKSLAEVHESIDTKSKTGFWRKLFAFLGPAYLISVGYMDPGNWATDIAGGSKFGYSLIWVLLMSNLMALLLQSLSARLGLVRGLDLAQASRAGYPPVINVFLWFLAEIAIAACDLAEVLGMAIGLQLLFDLPLLIGVSLTVLDTLLLLLLQQYGIRKIEAFILALIATIGLAFVAEMFFANPQPAEIIKGLIPSLAGNEALYIAIGIIGATVMPHNLYLHSSLVQTRKFERNPGGIREAIKFNFIDTTIALNLALFVNAAILILAAAAFYNRGYNDVREIQDAHKLLAPLLGTQLAPMLFAIALIAAGQSSTLTGTLSGQIVMEGYLNLRIQPWLRRLLTRMIAIVPAFLTIWLLGEDKTGELLILSQVILSLQLGFAIIPLIHFVSDKKTMGEFAVKPLVKFLSWICASVIVILNAKLIVETILEWINKSENDTLIYFVIIPVTITAAAVLLYITFMPLFKKRRRKTGAPHGDAKHLKISAAPEYTKIAITVDFSETDSKTISHGIAQGGKKAEYFLIHIVETAGALMMNNEIADFETETDETNLEKYAKDLMEKGYKVTVLLGYGNPKKEIPKIVNEQKADLLIMGVHGHKAFKDIVLGTTIDAVRHHVNIPVLIVQA